MKKIVFSLALVAMVAGTISASVNDGDKGKKKKKSCCSSSTQSGCNKTTATPAE